MFDSRGGEERKKSLFDSLVQLAILVVAVYGVVQNRIVWVLVLVFFLVLQNYTLVQHQILKIKLKRIERKLLAKYKARLQGFIKQGYQFVCGQNELSIPNRVRQIATKPGVKIPGYNPHIENIFYDILDSLKRRADNDIESLEDFKTISIEFFQTMNSFSLIYIDDFTRSLKRAEGYILIDESELIELRKCYISFHNFVSQHNTYRTELASDLGQDEAVCRLRIPTQVL